MSIDEHHELDRSIQRQLRWGMVVLIALVGGIGGWSASASINGAVIAPGTVIIKSNKKRVQHAEGGIVRTIKTAEGAIARRGQVLFQLDDTKVKAELDIARNRLFEALVKRNRLLAEREQLIDFAVTSEIKAIAGTSKKLGSVVSVQRNLIITRKEMRTNQKAQLAQRIAQFDKEIEGLKKQRDAKNEESSILRDEITNLTALYKQGLSPVARLNALRRAKSDVDYELGQILARIGQAGGKISEARLQILETDERYRNDTLTQLEETESKLLELKERTLALEDRLFRLRILAPLPGQVHELKIHTIGAVIAPGEVLAYIVPKAEDLIIEARIRLIDVDNVRVNQEANVRFTSFNFRTTPSIKARVASLSPDQIVEERSGEAYFKARVVLDEADRAKLGNNVVVAGMPAEVMITTKPRTVLNYLMQPLTDQINRAFREE